jgi:hypothetical protein
MSDAAKALRKWMKREKIPAYKVAELLGMCPSSVCEWMNRRKIPSLDARTKLNLLSGGFIPMEGWGLGEIPLLKQKMNTGADCFMTLDEIAEIEGVSRERVRQIISIALTKLHRLGHQHNPHRTLMRSLTQDYGKAGASESRAPP